MSRAHSFTSDFPEPHQGQVTTSLRFLSRDVNTYTHHFDPWKRIATHGRMTVVNRWDTVENDSVTSLVSVSLP